jgi:cytochrome c5
MASSQHDKAFFVTFMGVVGALVVFTFFVIVVARAIQGEEELTAGQIAKIEDRIRRVGAVNTDVAAALISTAEAAPAAKAPMSGEQVATQVCTACHTGAIPNAPKIGDKAAWSSRGSLDALTASAIKGKGAMPAKGGNPNLSDAEIKAAIKHMSGL